MSDNHEFLNQQESFKSYVYFPFYIGILYIFLDFIDQVFLEKKMNLDGTSYTYICLAIMILLGVKDQIFLKAHNAYAPNKILTIIPIIYLYIRQSKNTLSLKYLWINLIGLLIILLINII